MLELEKQKTRDWWYDVSVLSDIERNKHSCLCPEVAEDIDRSQSVLYEFFIVKTDSIQN